MKIGLRRANVRFLGLVIAILGGPSDSLGQTSRHGAIVGQVHGQTGKPLPGVRVAAVSSGGAGGEKLAYSDKKGSFQLRQLTPGTFELRFTGPELKTLVKRGVLVGSTIPTEIRVVMEVEVGGIDEVGGADAAAPSAERPVAMPRPIATVSNSAMRRCHRIIRDARAEIGGDREARQRLASVGRLQTRTPSTFPRDLIMALHAEVGARSGAASSMQAFADEQWTSGHDTGPSSWSCRSPWGPPSSRPRPSTPSVRS